MRNSGKEFPYPVLSFETSDIQNSYLKFTYTIIESDNLKCLVKVDLKNRTIKNLIKNGKASIISNIECSKTKFRKVIRSQDYEYNFEINNKLLSNKVEISSMIVTNEDLKYSNTQFNSDYIGDIYYIPKNHIIAYDEDITLNIERDFDSLENLPSIFSIIENIEEEAFSLDLDLTGSKIIIKLNQASYESYKILSLDQNLEEILASTIIIPCLTKILSDFENIKREYGDTNWFYSINSRLEKLNLTNTEDICEGAFKYSYLLLDNIFEKSLEKLEELNLDEE